ncbi:TatD family hydrolase [Stella sp.]|uniref:TatD family hydrolase n=1 Tax=Stella sp. TaxID=2912054 RepID=UPI0035B168F8
MLVDSHCHLDFPDFDAERAAVLARARAAGVRTMLTIGTKLTEFERVRAIAEAEPDVWCSVGIHPHEAASEPEVGTAELLRLADHPRVVAIGECGLDFFYDHSPRDRQEAVFRVHAAAARAAGLPLVVHSRDSDEDMIRVLTEESDGGRLRGVLHCFSSGRRLAEEAVRLGFHISFSGILTFKKADELRAIARDLPADRLLVETDAPYLAPIPHRGKRNEPAFVGHTAARLAEIRGTSIAEIEALTTDNFFRLFDRAARPAAAA